MGEVRGSATRTAGGRLALALIALLLAVPAVANPSTPTAPGTQIVNVATSQAEISGSTEATRAIVSIESNEVITVVSALLDLPLTLSVAPDTTVPPGTGLTYTLEFRNSGTAALTGVRLQLPLDALLPAPTAFTGPGSPPVLAATYDPILHGVTWDLAPLAPGTAGAVSLQVGVPAVTPDDTLLQAQGIGTAAELPAPVVSNPVDVHVLGPVLTLAKRADREAAEIGDSVGYALTLGNTSSTIDLLDLEVRDVLPPGLRYAPGSARLDSAPIAEPTVGADGRSLRFVLPALAASSASRLTYRARIGPGAERGDGVNTAVATARSPAGGTLLAGPVQAGVRISAGIFSGEAVVLGRVWLDQDGDGRVSAGEPGLPGVRLLLEDGTYVQTDVLGLYHLEGVRPGLHVLRLDDATLPPGFQPWISGNRSAFDADTQFLDLAPDDLFKANFPVIGPAGVPFAALEVYVDLEPRPRLTLLADAFCTGAGPVPAFAQRTEEVARYLRDLGLDPGRLRVKATPGAPEQAAILVGDELGRLLHASAGETASGPSREPAGALSDEEIRGMPATLAFLSPADGLAVPTASGNVVVRVPLPARPSLEVNGRPVPSSQIARTQEWAGGGLAVYTYLNVAFEEGRNTLRLRSRDGKVLGEEVRERTVFRAGPPGIIRMEAEPTPADGRTEATVTMQVLDLAGHAVSDGTVATVRSDGGEIRGIDADPSREGFQVRTRGGSATFRLPPSADAGEERVSAESGLARGEGVVRYVAAAGKWVVAGLAEARFGGDAVGGLSAVDGAQIGDEPDPTADGRTAFFARGSAGGDNVLTFAYDSDRPNDPEKLYRQIPPDRFFPAYGDSSQQYYAAETSGKLFARWENQGSTAFWGDYDTGLDAAELTRYDRRLYGLNADLNYGPFQAKLFGADTPQTLIRDEIPGAGISGPYELSRRPIVVNTDHITIEVRDRFHTERVLSSREMIRYIDYEIDYLRGEILFKQPIAAQDEQFNPVTIVAFYESDDPGDTHRLLGGRAAYRVGDRFEIGGTYVVEGHQAGDYTLGGTDLTYRPLPGVRMHAEYARSDEEFGLSGDALLFDAAWNIGGRGEVRGYFRQLDPGYVNPSRSGALQEGTRKFGVEGRADITSDLRFRGAAFSQEDLRNGFRQEVVEAAVEKDFGRVVATGGYRYTAQDGGPAPPVSAQMLNAGARVHVTRRIDVTAEHDQVLGSENVVNYPTRTRGGFEYRLPDGSKAFVVQEFEHGDAGHGATTLAGVETRLSEHTVMTGAYTLENSIAGSANRANLGLNTTLPIAPLWTASFFGQHVETLAGDPAADFTSLGAGFEFLPEGVKFSSRYEVRFGDLDTRHLLTAAGALKLGPRYTLFLREQLTVTDVSGGPTATDHALLAGVAFRPVSSDVFNWLARLDHHLEGGLSAIGAPKGEVLAGVFALNVSPSPRWLLSSKLAGRQVTEEVEPAVLRTFTGLAQFRLGYDLTPRWNVGATARLMSQPAAEVRETGLGIEAGFLAWKDLWVVGGYNLTGFDDAAIPEADDSEKGPYLAIRFKFDEGSLRSLIGR